MGAAASGEGAGVAAPVADRQVRFGEPAGRWVLLATVLGSGLAMLDATVVNVALPRDRRPTSAPTSADCSGRSTATR